MNNFDRHEFNDFLESLVASLEVPSFMYEKALRRFDSITQHLRRPASKLGDINISLYPQGSFNLGTAIKPFEEDGHYDVDVVCELEISKRRISQKSLKEMVGIELKEYHKNNGFQKKLEDNRRCWTLLYADAEQFHMDILPAIPDKDGFNKILCEKKASAQWNDFAIAITDKKHNQFSAITDNWHVSNPKGYAEWFKGRISTSIQKLAEARSVRVEEIPTHNVNSTLQMVIKILKRHRDILFGTDFENKPISIIITTLAAQFYNYEDSVFSALLNIVNKLSDFVERSSAELKVQNPVNPLEFFTDKWVEQKQKEKAFRFWVSRIKEDIDTAIEANDITKIAELFVPTFGDTMIKTAVEEYNKKRLSTQQIALNESIAPNEFNVTHKQKLKWRENLQYIVRVKAIVSRDGFPPYVVPSNSTPIDKHCSLRFEASTNAPRKKYKVHWQVVNTGAEASRNNALRGDYYDGFIEKGKLVRKESTLYTGRHWVECFIVLDNVCVARSGEYVINIK